MNIEDTKRNKNLLRVAMEIAGKGASRGEMGLDEIEVVRTNGAEVQQPVEESEITQEDLEAIAEAVVAELIKIEESLDFELIDEELDFAIDQVIDNLLSEG